jgi:hypothetical protein
MCKELPVIPVNKVVNPKRIIGKKEGQGGGEAQGVADTKKYIMHKRTHTKPGLMPRAKMFTDFFTWNL